MGGRRGGRRRVAALVVSFGVFVAGCGGSGAQDTGASDSTTGPLASAPSGGAPEASVAGNTVSLADCTVAVGPGGAPTIQAAADVAQPGDVICVSGDRSAERTVLRRGGEPGRPVVLRGDGSPTAGFVVEAPNVALQGFLVTTAGRPGNPEEGSGIFIAATDVSVTGNRVEHTALNGIECDDDPPFCDRARIVDNDVVGADGQGVIVYGDAAVVEANEISHSVSVNSDDADGVRFFGTNHRLAGNYIHDIDEPGPDDENSPHEDCFQTYDLGGWSSRDIVIESNTCESVGHHCLIATAGFSDVPIAQPSGNIIFRNNICDTIGAQGVYLVGIGNVLVVNNLFLERIVYYGVHATEGSHDISVLNNAFIGDYWPYDQDGTSGAGWRVEGNLAQPVEDDEPPTSWAEPRERWGVDLGLVITRGDRGPRAEVRPGAAVVDAGIDLGEALTGLADFVGRPRTVDGDGDGRPRLDVGPLEYQPGAAPAARGG